MAAVEVSDEAAFRAAVATQAAFVVVKAHMRLLDKLMPGPQLRAIIVRPVQFCKSAILHVDADLFEPPSLCTCTCLFTQT